MRFHSTLVAFQTTPHSQSLIAWRILCSWPMSGRTRPRVLLCKDVALLSLASRPLEVR